MQLLLIPIVGFLGLGIYVLCFWRFTYEHSRKIKTFDFGMYCLAVGVIALVVYAFYG